VKLSAAERHVAPVALCAVAPLALLVETTLGQALQARRDHGGYAIDFRPVWLAAHDFVHGVSPYLTQPSALLTMPQPIEAYVYPPGVAALFVPLGALSYGAAAAVANVIALVAFAAALAVLGVRDWRCYGVALASPAAITAVTQGGLTPLLALAVALAWRYRDSAGRCGLALGAAIAAKLFLWPLLVWLVLTKRYRAAGVAAASGAVAIAGAWSRLGFAGLTSYPALMRDLARAEAHLGYGAGAVVGTGTALWLVTAAAVAAAAAFTRRNDAALFTVLTLVALFASPILWLHYFALLVPLIAIRSRTLSVAWFVPLLFWLHPFQHGGSPTIVAFAAVVAISAVWRSREVYRGLLGAPPAAMT